MTFVSTRFWFEEEGYHVSLFHTKVIVRDRACALTIDHWNSINAASIEMVEKLELPLTPHPQPYILHWGRDKLTITHQTKVQFFLGKISYEILCDVIPVHIVSCHLLLGRPWCSVQGAVYFMDSHYITYKYIVT